ncbi:MAG: ABC transporter substrate-binding protein [Alphaproteobacteria bacterium]|nr:ABC transporter substrate-binding protein [Alphaproteobacteria bacterium]
MRTIRLFSKILILAVISLTLPIPANAIESINGLKHNQFSFIKIEINNDNNAENKKIAGAENFVGSMAQRAIGFLSDETLTREQQIKKFQKLLNNTFDMKTIARFSLGRYWRTSTKQEQQEYLALFKDMIINIYSERFGEYSGQNLEVRSARTEGKSDTIVTTYIVPKKGVEIQVDWRVRYKDGRYKVIDVIVEGISMAVTQRSDFASVIQRGGGDVNVLIVHLQQ